MGFSQTHFHFQCCFATYKVSYDNNDTTRRNSVAELFVFIKSENTFTYFFYIRTKTRKQIQIFQKITKRSFKQACKYLVSFFQTPFKF